MHAQGGLLWPLPLPRPGKGPQIIGWAADKFLCGDHAPSLVLGGCTEGLSDRSLTSRIDLALKNSRGVKGRSLLRHVMARWILYVTCPR